MTKKDYHLRTITRAPEPAQVIPDVVFDVLVNLLIEFELRKTEKAFGFLDEGSQ